uniref:Uncharacterized protein n=1 Tax=Anguilla anguilla TaxID=7936 RepID=A0A0E9S8C8_ANGAN
MAEAVIPALYPGQD